MPFDIITLKDKIKKLEAAFQSGLFADALVGALHTGSALMQQRIFNTNVDIENNGFGTYIGPKRRVRFTPGRTPTETKRLRKLAGTYLTAHQRKRAAAGRQIKKKDLELYGSLRRAIEVQAVDETTAVIQFTDIDSAKIARGQENQITNIREGRPGYTTGDGIRIFRINDDEREEISEQLRELIMQILK